MKPISPVLSAVFTADSETPSARFTRSSNGSFASRRTCSVTFIWSPAMERPVQHVQLLLARQPHEVHCVSRYTNRKTRIFLRMVHRVQQRIPIEHIHVHVITGRAEERVKHRAQVWRAIFFNSAETFRQQRRSQRNAISRIAVRNLRD